MDGGSRHGVGKLTFLDAVCVKFQATWGCVFVLGILLTTVRHSDDSKPHLSNLSEGGSLSSVKISFQKARSREIKLRYISIATSYVAWKAPCPFPYDVKINGVKEGYHKPTYSSIHVYYVGFGSSVCLTLGSPEELLCQFHCFYILGQVACWKLLPHSSENNHSPFRMTKAQQSGRGCMFGSSVMIMVQLNPKTSVFGGEALGRD